MKGYLYILFFVLIFFFISCKGRNTKPIEIYELDEHYYSDSMLYRNFIIYNLPQKADSNFIKANTKKFLDTLLNNNVGIVYNQIKFYKHSSHLDTTFTTSRLFDNGFLDKLFPTGRDAIFDELYLHTEDLIAEFRFYRNQEGYWDFYKDGEQIGAPDIKIENIPENDTLFKKQQ